MLAKVASSPLPKRKVLRELGIPKSTYYRWLRRKDQQRLEDDAGGGKPVWNRLTFQEVRYVLSAARQLPELSCRQLAAWITDNQGFSVSESTVYRILRREGLVKSPEMQLAAGKEFHRKTTRPHQMWATDASYFRVVGWGYYYMVTVMDDYSRFIIAYKLQRDMTSDSFIHEVVQEAVDRTGMDQVAVVSQQLQGPTGTPLRRFPAGHRYQPCFTFAVQSLLTPTQLLFAIQRRLDPLLHTALAYSLDR